MKNLVTVLVLCFILISAPAMASTFGPAEPIAEPGRYSLGVGIFHYTGNLEFDDNIFPDSEIDQTRFFLQGTLRVGKSSELYARVGGSDLEYEDAFLDTVSLEGDTAPFGSLGFKSTIHENRGFTIGYFVEGTVYDGYDDAMDFVNTSGGITRVVIDIDPSWEGNFGFTFQKEIEGAYLYGGPVAYYRSGDADLTSVNPVVSASDSYTEENFFGAFLGAHWAMKNGVRVELESQFKSEVSFGAAVSYSF